MEMFLKWSYKLLIKFDVYFRNIEVFNYFLNIKIIKKLHLNVQKDAEYCMYPCDVISSVA